LPLLPESTKVLFVGEGETLIECKELTNQLKLEHRTFFLGARMDVPKLLKSCDFVVLSTFFEGLSLSCIEGLASGKPFLGSNVDGLSNVIKDAGILFEQGNEEELANNISILINDKNLYDKVAKDCIEKSKEYDINFMIQKHISMYKSLMK